MHLSCRRLHWSTQALGLKIPWDVRPVRVQIPPPAYYLRGSGLLDRRVRPVSCVRLKSLLSVSPQYPLLRDSDVLC